MLKSHRTRRKYANRLLAFGENLRRIREDKGMTQEQVAFKADISFTTINNLENGHVNPTLSTLFAISDSLKIPIAELFREKKK